MKCWASSKLSFSCFIVLSKIFCTLSGGKTRVWRFCLFFFHCSVWDFSRTDHNEKNEIRDLYKNMIVNALHFFHGALVYYVSKDSRNESVWIYGGGGGGRFLGENEKFQSLSFPPRRVAPEIQAGRKFPFLAPETRKSMHVHICVCVCMYAYMYVEEIHHVNYLACD